MDADVALAAAVVLMALSLPALVAAWANQRPPWLAGAMILVALGLALAAYRLHPGGYGVEEVPDVLLGVLERILN